MEVHFPGKKCYVTLEWPLIAKLANTVMSLISAGSILDTSKYCDTCECSISILDGISIYRISNDQTILGRYFVRSGVSSHSILKQPSIWRHCPKTSISQYLLLIVRLSIHQTSIWVSSIAKRFLVIFKYRRTESIVHLPSNS